MKFIQEAPLGAIFLLVLAVIALVITFMPNLRIRFEYWWSKATNAPVSSDTKIPEPPSVYKNKPDNISVILLDYLNSSTEKIPIENIRTYLKSRGYIFTGQYASEDGIADFVLRTNIQSIKKGSAPNSILFERKDNLLWVIRPKKNPQ